MPGLNVRDLLPAKTNEFYYYKGSDFKPPCDERLVIVFKEIMEVSWFQVTFPLLVLQLIIIIIWVLI